MSTTVTVPTSTSTVTWLAAPTDTTTPPAAVPGASQAFVDLIKQRRSHYKVTGDLPISRSRVDELAQTLLLHVPTAFNSQTTRAVSLHGRDHERLWDTVLAALQGALAADPDKLADLSGRVAAHRASAGTVLVLYDQEGVSALQRKFPQYAAMFEPWAVQTAGMFEFAMWTALAAEGVGASLQHFGFFVQDAVRDLWKLPDSWKIDAMLVYGRRVGDWNEKTFDPVQGRFASFGADKADASE